jgi:hypothetical protein
MALRIRRGLSTSRTSITPAEGEFIYTTDTKLVYIGDGSTAGGVAVGGSSTSQYLQVANAAATYETKTTANSRLANTNAYIATRASRSELLGTNTALRTLISDRLQVGNAAATYQTIATERAALANTNSRITLVNSNLTGTNTALRGLISDRLQVANAASTYETKSDANAKLANTNSYIATKASWTALTGTNTALRTLINDRYQVANVNTNFFKKTGVIAQTVTPLTTFSANVSIEGKLFVTGGIQTYSANNLSVGDNMIYLNSNSSTANPDLGFAGNYNDGTYHHAGFFRDASDAGTWKVFENYGPEPDANVYINTSHATFRLAPFAAQNIRAARNLVVVANSTLGNTSVTGFLKLNNTDIRTTFAQNTYVNSILANTNSYIAARASWSALTSTNTDLRTLISDRLQVANASTLYATKSNPTTSGFFAHTGRATISTNLDVSGNTSISGLLANSSLGSTGQVLKTNGTSVYWGTAASGGGGGGFANGQSISVLNFIVTGNSTLGGANKTTTATGLVTVTGRQTISQNLYVSGNTVLGDPTNISERTTINGTLFANGNISLNGNTVIGAAGKTANVTGWFGVNGRATVGTNLFIAGNTTVKGLVANGSLGTANFVLKTNGTTTFWGAAASGGGATLSNETASATTHYPAMSTTSSGSWTSAIVSTTKLYFTPSTGQLNATIFNSLSDKRVKKNIKTVDNALDTVNNMRGVRFNWKETDTPSIGLIAQEVQKSLPELVHKGDNGEMSVNYGGLVGVLVEAIKELSERIEKLEGK